MLGWRDVPWPVPFLLLAVGAVWGVVNWWRRRKRVVVCCLPLLALVGHGVWFFSLARYDDPVAVLAMDQLAPQFEVTRVANGRPLRLRDERGHPVLLVFFRGAW